jgi:MFS transporter, Spinster family, sphingosine-1-phosphate transporter
MEDAEMAEHFNPTVVYSLFTLVFIANVLINVDHGTMPACTDNVKAKLDINDFGFGVLGSVVYGGLTFGSGVATMVFNKGEYIKPALIISLFANTLALYMFTATSWFYFSLVCRGFIGFF